MSNSRSHVFRHTVELPAEAAILGEFVTERTRVLDVGTGATGRTATLIASFGPETVTSIEVNPAAVTVFAAERTDRRVLLAAADLARLPFDRAAFDLVMIGFHGFDYLIDPAIRAVALREVQRVLAPGGTFVFSAWNRIAIMVSPVGLTSLHRVRVRLRYWLRGDVARSTLLDGNGLRLHQATPRATIAEVERATDLEFAYMIDTRGRSRSTRVVSLKEIEPYYVFRRPG